MSALAPAVGARASAARLLSAALLAQLASPPCVAVRVEARLSPVANASGGPAASRDAAAGPGSAAPRAAGPAGHEEDPRGLPPAAPEAGAAAGRAPAAPPGGGPPFPLHRLLLLASGAAPGAAPAQRGPPPAETPAPAPVRAGAAQSMQVGVGGGRAAAAAGRLGGPGGEDANASGTTALVAQWIQWASAPAKAPASPWRACLGGLLAVVALGTPLACCAGRLRRDGCPNGEVVAFRPGAAQKPRRAAAPGPPRGPRAEQRLARCGASFVVPAGAALPPARQGGSSTTLSFDVPARPADWQFRASLWRPDPGSHWRLLQLTVDVIAASGLPPLLSARSTGNAGTLDVCGAPSPAVVITEGAGTVAASILAPSGDGRRVVRREGRSDWELQVVGPSAPDDFPSIRVRRNGQEIGLSAAAGAPGRARRALQFDVLPEANSPELPLLLICMLAAVVFQL